VDWQQLIALLIVAGTVSVLVLRAVKRRRRGGVGQCAGGGCGCGGATGEDKPRIIFHARKGERPEVIIKSP
jgi:hypothetical protein